KATTGDDRKITLRKFFPIETRLECEICADHFENGGFGFAMLSEDNQFLPVCSYFGKEKAPELYRVWQEAMEWKEWAVSVALKKMAQQTFEAIEPDVAKRVTMTLNGFDGIYVYHHDIDHEIPF
ncbi:MAG: hypothetical protein KAH23_10385, partial [Kiritimatiellae bacterium]|nr:hypothetical protein [Kiritimatiellia bacterium]